LRRSAFARRIRMYPRMYARLHWRHSGPLLGCSYVFVLVMRWSPALHNRPRFIAVMLGGVGQKGKPDEELHLLAILRIKRIDQAVAQKVEAHHGEHDGRAWKNGQMVGQAEVAAAGGEHGAPRRRGRLHAQSEK